MFLEQKLIIWPFGSFNSLSTIAAEQGRIVAVVTQYRKKYMIIALTPKKLNAEHGEVFFWYAPVYA